MQKIPPITRNLLIINVVCFLIQWIFEKRGVDVADLLGLHFILASDFSVFQLVTYMFLHGSFLHLFFNMFSLWMFGGIIEHTLGARRFLIYFIVCGIGAGLCQEVWQTAQYMIDGMYKYEMVNLGAQIIPMGEFLNYWTTIGASGACYGVLLAFGILYPNERLMLLIPPIPMKAKYFVAGYAVIELIAAYSSNDNIAHFAHLGGMLFGWLLLVIWRHRARRTMSGSREWSGAPRASFMQRFKNFWKKSFKRKSTTVGNAHHTSVRESDYEYNARAKQDEERMDEILEKVSRSGYDSLTPEEKRELFRISRR